MSTTYKNYRTAENEPIQVESAVRDGIGRKIDETYATKAELPITEGNKLKVSKVNLTPEVVGTFDNVDYYHKTVFDLESLGALSDRHCFSLRTAEEISLGSRFNESTMVSTLSGPPGASNVAWLICYARDAGAQPPLEINIRMSSNQYTSEVTYTSRAFEVVDVYSDVTDNTKIYLPGATAFYGDLSADGKTFTAYFNLETDVMPTHVGTVTDGENELPIHDERADILPYMERVTYAELKQLRDEGKLVPGKNYRIIDYVTTTAQADTKSAGHLFDIIVIADDEHTLNENARAIYHLDNAKDIKSFYLTAMGDYYTRYPAEDGDYEGEHYYAFRGTGDDTSYTYTKSLTEIPTGETVYCFISSGGSWVPLSSEDIAKVTTVKEDDNDDVQQIEFEDYFGNCNLYAWQIKYCLDNNTSRFGWANTAEEEGAVYDYNLCPYVGTYIYDGKAYYEFRYTSAGTSNVFALTRYPMKGDTLFLKQDDEIYSDDSFTDDYQFTGKGVIYWMKDEFDNEAYYDFKNILFKRYDVSEFELVEGQYFNGFSQKIEDWFNGVKSNLPYRFYRAYSDPETGEEAVDDGYPDLLDKTEDEVLNSGLTYCILDDPDWNGDPGLIAQFDASSISYDWFYTFTNRINDINTDKSLTWRCSHNKIVADFGANGVIPLYDNVFINTEIEFNCDYNTLGDNCYYNTFGNGCYSNTFSYNCYYNTLGRDCLANIFGEDCYLNSFGDSCNSNIFGGKCHNNIFSTTCHSNTFGDNCSSNTFGAFCDYNTLGDNCYSNILGSDCRSNSFGSVCSNNTLGNHCHSNRLDADAEFNEIDIYARWNVFESGVNYVVLEGNTLAANNNQIQYVKIHSGVQGTSSTPKTIMVDRKLSHETNIVPAGIVYTEV